MKGKDFPICDVVIEFDDWAGFSIYEGKLSKLKIGKLHAQWCDIKSAQETSKNILIVLNHNFKITMTLLKRDFSGLLISLPNFCYIDPCGLTNLVLHGILRFIHFTIVYVPNYSSKI
jgi:hypothetical protein